jgi:hypothetical protein
MPKESIFVFGSNLAGRHGKGAALEAVTKHGAVYGKGVGLYGKSYAIPTKDEDLKTLPLNRIGKYVDTFLRFARLNPEMKFEVTRIGCGLAGYEDKDIAPMFKDSPNNVILPAGWRVMSNDRP